MTTDLRAYFATARLPAPIHLCPGVKITNPALFVRAQLARMQGNGKAARIAEWHLLQLRTLIEKENEQNEKKMEIKP